MSSLRPSETKLRDGSSTVRTRAWASAMAAIVVIPVALLYNFFLDRFIAGFTLGAVKG